MQVGLAVFFFSLLATSTVLADDADSEGWQFVQENGRTYGINYRNRPRKKNK